MNKLKLYLYPQAMAPLHDHEDHYHNTIPFCNEGMKQWVDMVPMKDAEFYHMGQVREFAPYPYDQLCTFWKWTKEPGKHIVDLEGDYAEGTFRDEFNGAVRVACGAPHRWRESGNVFPRPTMSRLLLELFRSNAPAMDPPKEKAFGFIGKSDSWGVRERVVKASVGLEIPAHMALNQTWNGPSDPASPCRAVYRQNMQQCSVSICPQGEHAVNTARFYESCCFGRFPVLIGETMLPGEDVFDTSFVCQMDSRLSAEDIHANLQKISAISLDEMIDRGKAARAYWDAVLVPYFQDPTLCFLQWLERHGLRNQQL